MTLLTTYLMADVINGVQYCDADDVGDNQCFVEWDFYDRLKDTDKLIYGLVSDDVLHRIEYEYGVNLFANLEGADLDRLAECLKAIRTAGLHASKYTQAGVNRSSGNVWVCDENWAGCIDCSIRFDVSWYHSCPECSDEHEFDTYDELTEYVEKYDGKCPACSPKYAAGWNMPGYMPDSEPAKFDSADEAREYIAETLERLMDDESTISDEEAPNLQGIIETIRAESGELQTGNLYGHFYWVVKQ